MLSYIQENVDLSKYCTFRIGGMAKYFVEIDTKEKLEEVFKIIENGELRIDNYGTGNKKTERMKYFILGGGSNVLFSDEGFDGLVIKMNNQQLTGFGEEGFFLVEAGYSFPKFVSEMDKLGFFTAHWLGIPGTIGGAVAVNAGPGQGGGIGDSVVSGLVYNLEVIEDGELSGRIGEMNKLRVKENNNNSQSSIGEGEGGLNSQFDRWREVGGEWFEFEYRNTAIKSGKKKAIIWSVILKLHKKEVVPTEIREKYETHMQSKNEFQKNLGGASAGCFFKNPPNVSAGKLIDECGLKGYQIGGAMVSNGHANFIVNTGGASAKDILELVELIKQKVKDKFGVGLEEEVIINF